MPKDARYFIDPAAEGKPLTRSQILQANQALLKIQNRLDRLERVATKKPPTPKGLTVEGRQGSFQVTWQKVVGVDGYILIMASDSAMTQVTHRFEITGQETIAWAVPWANVSSTRYFQIWSTRAGLQSDPSETKSAATVAFGAGESAPTAPTGYSSNPESAPSNLGIVSGTRDFGRVIDRSELE